MRTLYVGSENIDSNGFIGTREEWELALKDVWEDWWNGSESQENDVTIEEYAKMTLDSELREADEDEINDPYYKRLDPVIGTFQRIEKEINSVKEWNQEAGNRLHQQFSEACNAEWTSEELSTFLKSDEDVADEFYKVGDERHSEIRNIQDSIISFCRE